MLKRVLFVSTLLLSQTSFAQEPGRPEIKYDFSVRVEAVEYLAATGGRYLGDVSILGTWNNGESGWKRFSFHRDIAEQCSKLLHMSMALAGTEDKAAVKGLSTVKLSVNNENLVKACFAGTRS